jgi:hypothetical protein
MAHRNFHKAVPMNSAVAGISHKVLPSIRKAMAIFDHRPRNFSQSQPDFSQSEGNF